MRKLPRIKHQKTWIVLGILSMFAMLLSCSVNLRTARKDPQLQSLQIEQATGKKHYRGYRRDARKNARRMLKEGRRIFRYETFGDEAFWSDTLGLDKVILGESQGGIGPGLQPIDALRLGLKVDRRKITPLVVLALRLHLVPLNSTFITRVLLKTHAVVGVRAQYSNIFDFKPNKIGVTCAVCHSTTDNSVGPGIGRRLDGWGNRDINVGAIIAMSPNLQHVATQLNVDTATLRKVLASWGPGRYDAEINHDGIAFRPDQKTASTVMPVAWGLAGINLHTYNGWGSVTYWNAYVANTQMHGQGRFFDPRMNNAEKFPLAVKNKNWNRKSDTDLVTDKLAALHYYQLSLPVPDAPKRIYDKNAAMRGKIVFNGKANCASCHVPPLYTEPGHALHKASEIGIDDFQAKRSPEEMYRTTPLGGVFTRTKGGFYHDGRFKSLMDVVNHYNGFMKLNLTEEEKKDLVEFLKSI